MHGAYWVFLDFNPALNDINGMECAKNGISCAIYGSLKLKVKLDCLRFKGRSFFRIHPCHNCYYSSGKQAIKLTFKPRMNARLLILLSLAVTVTLHNATVETEPGGKAFAGQGWGHEQLAIAITTADSHCRRSHATIHQLVATTTHISC
jgi:hypothetical protein